MTVTREIDLRAAARQVMLANGFAPDFPPEVREEIAELGSAAPRDAAADAVGAGVRDLRQLLWSSIDNRESRDLDQVEFAERLADGAIRLHIGVADVDALVPKDSAVDRHASVNTTSVYTGVVVFPMLPERLSTDLTSLNEGADRFAIIIELDVAPDGSVAREIVYRALVRNHAKLAYDAVGLWLSGAGPIPHKVREYAGLETQLRLQEETALRLHGLRERRGALDFESIEPRPVVSHGKVIDLKAAPQDRAREIIEHFMVAANSAMARHLEDRHVAAIRRVVRTPRRWPRIVEIARDLGEALPPEPDALALSAFLTRRRAVDPDHFPDLSLTIVKLLGPGEYVLERRFDGRQSNGHFGLSLAEYLHSTAPNRRFPDLVTQRLAKAPRERQPYGEDELMAIARHCTEQEDAAKKVERTMRKRVAAVFMADRIGDSFPAVVTGASRKGVYVRLLRPPVEGRVVRGGQGLDVGDTVRVTLIATDPEQGFIDFEHEHKDTPRKLERSRRKKAAAMQLAGRVGDAFDATVTGVTPHGTWVRLLDVPIDGAEGKLVRGAAGVAKGQRVRVRLLATDAVHGFIDFERLEDGDADDGRAVASRKTERRRRKKAAALDLVDRIGDSFDAEVTGASERATWIHLLAPGPEVEGRLVRGWRGRSVGDRVRVVLLDADPRRGWIDFALE